MKKKYIQTLSANGYFINDKLEINPNLQSLQNKNTYRLKKDEIELSFYANKFKYFTHDDFEHNAYKRATMRLANKYGEGGNNDESAQKLISWSADCYFLDEIRIEIKRKDMYEYDYSSFYTTIDVVEIKTGFFEKIQVSYNAILCLTLLNIPLKSKKDWKAAMLLKEEVQNKYKELLEEDDKKKKIFIEEEKKERNKKREEKAKRKQEWNKKREESIEKKKKLKAKKQREKKKKEKEKLDKLIKKYGEEFGKKIYNKKLELRMSKEMTIAIYGKPKKVTEHVTKNSVKKSFFYDSYQTKFDNTKFSFRVDLENDEVVGWKDLD